MKPAIESTEQTVLYFNNFTLFNPADITMLCRYKQFIEKIIIRLGENWRIQSHLLSDDIIEIRKKESSETDFSNFNIFNELLSDFLKGKIGSENQFANYSYNLLQDTFNENLIQRFPQESIQKCLTYKALTLGFFIGGNDVWNKVFKGPKKQEKAINNIRAFGKVTKVLQSAIKTGSKSQVKSQNELSSIRGKMSQIDLLSFNEMESEKHEYANSMKSVWKEISEGDLSELQLIQIQNAIKKITHDNTKTQILQNFVCFVDELHFKSKKVVRVFSLSNQFYLFAFVVWVIFSIKTFFALQPEDFLRYARQLMQDQWKHEYERPLVRFQATIERERNKLINDFSVNLHDDEAVLVMLAKKMQDEIKREWDEQISSLKDCFEKQI